ncbi:MAG: ATP-binding protein, partial [Anaerolineae bacterium]|nr:ATP-binding protein [Anaerolineae bacterium]
NLVANSLKYHHPDKPPRIRITAAEETTWVIRVADNGVGISLEFQQEIFSPFRRLHTRNESEGVGLGLATCRRIIEQHGGKIWVESVPNEGTSFFFTLQKISDDPIAVKGHMP